MAQHTHLIGSINFGSCDAKDVEFFKSAIVSALQVCRFYNLSINKKESGTYKGTTYAPTLFYDFVYNGAYGDVYPEVTYSDFVLVLYGHSYNVDKLEWLMFFKEFLTTKYSGPISLHTVAIQIDIDGEIILINKPYSSDRIKCSNIVDEEYVS